MAQGKQRAMNELRAKSYDTELRAKNYENGRASEINESLVTRQPVNCRLDGTYSATICYETCVEDERWGSIDLESNLYKYNAY